MFNSPRNTNFKPNDDTSSKKQEWARYAAWSILAHPTTVLLLFLVVAADAKIGLPFKLVAIAFLIIPTVEAVLLRRQHGPRRLVMWANVIRFRRRWFTVWTATVKARDDHTTQVFGLLLLRTSSMNVFNRNPNPNPNQRPELDEKSLLGPTDTTITGSTQALATKPR